MKTMITVVTERGQVSIPSAIRRSLRVTPGERLVWEAVGEHECRVHRLEKKTIKGALAMRGYARQFRPVRPTAAWLREIRDGEAD